MAPPTIEELLDRKSWGCIDGYYDYEVVSDNYAATIYHRLYDGTFWRITYNTGLSGNSMTLKQVKQKQVIIYKDV